LNIEDSDPDEELAIVPKSIRNAKVFKYI
jgi:hypothetical protein